MMMIVLEKGHRDIEAGHHVKTERQAQPEANDGRERHLAEAGHQRDRAKRTHKSEIEFKPDEEQEHRHAEFGQKLDLVLRLNEPEQRGSNEHTDCNKASDERLAQPLAEQP